MIKQTIRALREYGSWIVRQGQYSELKDSIVGYAPIWTSDSRYLIFLADLENNTGLYRRAIPSGKSELLYALPVSPGDMKLSPDGCWLAFTARLYGGTDNLDACRKYMDQRKSGLVKARIIEDLPYRLWNEWCHDYREHLFAVRIKDLALPKPEFYDLTPDFSYIPPLDLGSGNDFSFSPDSRADGFCGQPGF